MVLYLLVVALGMLWVMNIVNLAGLRGPAMVHDLKTSTLFSGDGPDTCLHTNLVGMHACIDIYKYIYL